MRAQNSTPNDAVGVQDCTVDTTYVCKVKMITLFQNNTVKLDFEYFVHLFEEYYLSDDASSLGNFINGRLEYDTIYENDDEDDEEEDPGALDHRVVSTTSIHSMDDDIQGGKNGDLKKTSSIVRLHERATLLCKEVKQSDCCVII